MQEQSHDKKSKMIAGLLIPLLNLWLGMIYLLAVFFTFVRDGHYFSILKLLMLSCIFLVGYYLVPVGILQLVKSDSVSEGFGLIFGAAWAIAIFYYVDYFISWIFKVNFSADQLSIDKSKKLLAEGKIDFFFGFSPSVGIKINRQKMYFIYRDGILEYDLTNVVGYECEYRELSDSKGNISFLDPVVKFSLSDFNCPVIVSQMLSLDNARNAVERVSQVIGHPEVIVNSPRRILKDIN